MHRNVELLIGRLATDSKLRRRFAATPEELLRELAEGGLELTEIELVALATTDPEAFRRLAGALDARLRRYEPTALEATEDPNPGPNPNDPEPAEPNRQERSS